MAKITSRALLNVGQELIINEPARTFQLVATGNLIAKDKVAMQALYSKFVDLWTSASYQDSPFPIYAIDALSGQYRLGTDGTTFNGWKPLDDTTRQMIADGGWEEYSAAGALNRVYVGAVGLGAVSSGAQLYFQRTASDAPTNFTFTDQCNEAIQVYGDAANGNFDKRSYFKAFVREQGKKYRDSVLSDTGKTTTGAYIVNFLLSNEDDLKIIASDGAMSGAPYSGITVTYYNTDQMRTIGAGSYPFRVIIEGNGATLEQIYSKVQYLLRQGADIDSGAGTVIGKTASLLLEFLGDTLLTKTGVFIENFSAVDVNRVIFKDQTGTDRAFPFLAAGTISFNSFLVGAGSSYRLFYAAPAGAGNDFGEAGAITVNDANGNPIAGLISSSSISFTFDYDNDTAGGASGTNKAVVLVGIRAGSGKYAMATAMLTRSKTIALSLVAEQDRVYF